MSTANVPNLSVQDGSLLQKAYSLLTNKYVLVALALALVAVAVYYYRNMKKKKEQEQNLQLQKEQELQRRNEEAVKEAAVKQTPLAEEKK